MKNWRRASIFLILFLMVIGVQLQSHLNVASQRRSVGLVFKPPQMILSPKVTQIVAGEFNGLLADYILLEVGSFVGSNVQTTDSDYQNVYRALKQALLLDPYFQQTYLIVQGLLPWKAKLIDETLELLNISRKHRPWDWRPGHYMGFDYYYFKNDFNKASEVLIETAKIKNAPVLLAILGARLATKGQQTQAAIVMLKQLLKDDTLPDSEREDIEDRLTALNGVWALEKAIAQYADRNGAYPDNLEALVQQGIISAIPSNPYVDQFYYDSQTGCVDFDQNRIITHND